MLYMNMASLFRAKNVGPFCFYWSSCWIGSYFLVYTVELVIFNHGKLLLMYKLFCVALTFVITGCQKQDREEVRESYHREVLLSFDSWFPHQQESRRWYCRSSFQENEKQDFWFHYPFDEENCARPCSWHFPQVAGGREREKTGLRPRGTNTTAFSQLYQQLHYICSVSMLLRSAVNFICVCQKSAIEQDVIQIDSDTKDMLDAMDFKDLAGISVVATRS